MIPRHKKNAIIGFAVSIPLWGIGITLLLAEFGPWPIGPLLILASIPFYLWGCVALARAKGYSTAIVLTVVLGGLFPLVILLVLPDKHRQSRHRR